MSPLIGRKGRGKSLFLKIYKPLFLQKLNEHKSYLDKTKSSMNSVKDTVGVALYNFNENRAENNVSVRTQGRPFGYIRNPVCLEFGQTTVVVNQSVRIIHNVTFLLSLKILFLFLAAIKILHH